MSGTTEINRGAEKTNERQIWGEKKRKWSALSRAARLHCARYFTYLNTSQNPSLMPSFLQRLRSRISTTLPGRMLLLLSAINTHTEDWQLALTLWFAMPFRLGIGEPGCLNRLCLATAPQKKKLLQKLNPLTWQFCSTALLLSIDPQKISSHHR